jgi:hypothetical protein
VSVLRPAPAGAPATVAPQRAAAVPGALRAPLLRLAAFAALAMFAAAHWSSLVASADAGRTVLVVLVATGAAALLIALGAPGVRPALTAALGGRDRLAGAVVAAAALVVGVAGIALALGAAGLPMRLLAPANWGELFDGLDRGLAGIQSVDWPYAGPDEWVRRSILMGAPLLIGAAALVAFFPARRFKTPLHAAGLVLLLVVYGTAVTEHDPGEPLLRGLALLALVAAWLWLPRLESREALAGAGLVLSLGALSLPVAAALDSEQPWWDYRAWSWFGDGKAITFDWTHTYGPLDWPRDGTTLLHVKSDRPHYWKAETLDAFDGVRWGRGRTSDATQAGQGLPDPSVQSQRWDYFDWNRSWDERIRFTVRSLSTTLLVGAGDTYDVDGVAGPVSPSSDGTTRMAERLEEGDAYTISTYAPKPSVPQMRGMPSGFSPALLEFTTIELPAPGSNALESRDRLALGGEEVAVPIWGDEPYADPAAPREALTNSVYGDMYAIASRVTAGSPTMYDAVAGVERYLKRNFTYSEKPRGAQYPLNAFLFRDEFGYCQQFSGAMALMLRMAGIPSRVAAGFAPGSLNRDTGEYRVRDLDAHSWVEVYFNGIGWVPFDPTPPATPAQTQIGGLTPTSAPGGDIDQRRQGVASERAAEGSGSPVADSDSGASPWLLLPLLLVGGAGLATYLLYRRAGRLDPAELAEAQLAELRRALPRLDWEVPAGTTLLGLERRLDRAAGPAAARYAARLREHRFDPRSPAAPTLRDRRELRRDLTARGGLRARLVGLIAIPPGGPRPV